MLVQGRGLWFETFMLVFSSYQCHRDLVSAMVAEKKRATEATDECHPLPSEIYEPIVQRDIGTFTGLSLLLCNNVSQSLTPQMFKFTMFLQSRGLSNNGRNVLARFGICMAKTTFIRKREEELKFAEEASRYLH